MKFLRLALGITMLTSAVAFAQQQVPSPSIIPVPTNLKPVQGHFILSKNTSIKLNAPKNFLPAFKELQGITASLPSAKSPSSNISINLDANIKQQEGYRLYIAKNEIKIYASTERGAFWAISTIKQLGGQELANHQTTKIGCVEISDQPKFEWRGMHLDVARHFFDMAYLRTMVDRMALYKFNKFHLHLTDDQGWRIEIKKYPELAEKGAWRTFNKHDSVCLDLAKSNPDYAIPEKHFKTINGQKMYGGFYTQTEMKDFITYAANHGIEVIPEIDMPGHMMAANKLFPWLTASGTGTKGKGFSEPICPCKETTFEFAENIFTEIANLFPSKYIHLGADEVEKDTWKTLPACQELMAKEGLKDVQELQSYFVKRMEKFFNSKGKKLIGWDEILEGGVSPTATMMFWRSWVPNAPKQAAEKGNDVIMTPGEFCYFDHKQDAGTLKRVYSFDPYDYNLTTEEKKKIKGVQANIWTEYIPSERRLEYMVFPRMLALAEVAWSGHEIGFDNFQKRVNQQFPLLDAMRINYRLLDLEGFSPKSVFVDSTELNLKNIPLNATVRYTTDGSLPTLASSIYSKPVTIKQSQQLKLVAFRPNGLPGELYVIDYQKQDYAEAMAVYQQKPGLVFSYYPKAYKTVSDLKQSDASFTTTTFNIDIPIAEKAQSFGTTHTGFLNVPNNAVYTFYLQSDDGSTLSIDGELLVDNDGLHSTVEKSAQMALGKGLHAFDLKFIEGGGGYTLKLQYSVNGGPRQDFSKESFYQ